MNGALFESSELRIHQDGGQIWCTPRTAIFWWLGAGMLAIAVLAWRAPAIAAWGQWRLTPDEQLALEVLQWVAGGGGVLMWAAGLRRRLGAHPVCFDLEAGVLRTHRHSVGLSQIERVYIDVKTVGTTETVGIAVVANGATLSLIPHQAARHAAELLKVVARLQVVLADQGHAVSDRILPTEAEASSSDRTVAWSLLVTGVGWAIVGLVFGREWIYALDENNGLLVWPMGVLLAALGAAELAGLQVIELMMTGKWRYRIPLLVGLAGAYLALCLRPLAG